MKQNLMTQVSKQEKYFKLKFFRKRIAFCYGDTVKWGQSTLIGVTGTDSILTVLIWIHNINIKNKTI